MGAANLPIFLQFGNANKSDICVMFPKNHGWPRNWEPLPPSGPGLKPPLLIALDVRLHVHYIALVNGGGLVTGQCGGQSVVVVVVISL